MQRRDTRALALVLALCAVAACGGGGRSEASAKAAKAAMKAMPKNTPVVMGFAVQSFKKSKVYKELLEKRIKEGDIKDKLDTVKKECGIDPVNDIESVVVGMNPESEDKTQQFRMVVIKGKIDEAKVDKCVPALAKMDDKTLTVEKDGKVTVFKGEETLYGVWLEKDTFMVTPDGDHAKAVADGKGEGPSDEISDLIGKVDTGATMWMAGTIADLGDIGGRLPAKPVGGWATIKLADGAKIDAGLRFGSSDDAKEVTEQLKGELDAAKDQAPDDIKGALKSVKVSTKDKDMLIKAEINGKAMGKIISAAKMMLD